MKLVKLTRGQFAKVDDEDFEKVSKNKWTAEKLTRGGFYALRGISIQGKQTTIRMHRFILNATKGQIVDHINGDTLDNQKANLRFCTAKENARNRAITKRNKYGYIGIRKKIYKTIAPKYQALISIEGKQKSLGFFKTKKQAALEYKKFAKTVYKNFFRE